MAEQKQIASVSVYIETDETNVIQIASTSAYVETSETGVIQIDSVSVYIEYRDAQIDVAQGFTSDGVATDGSDRLYKDTNIKHTGESSQRIIVDSTDKGIITEENVIASDSNIYIISAWLYGHSGDIQIIDDQGGTIINETLTPTADVWTNVNIKGKGKDVAAKVKFLSKNGPADFNVDDIVIIPSSVSLTATATNLANSEEGGGLRIAGGSIATQEITLPGSGGILIGNYVPRHIPADVVKFGNTESYFFDLYTDSNNYIRAYWSDADTITLAFNAGGAGEQSDTYNLSSWNIGEVKELKCEYGQTSVLLKIDSVEVINIPKTSSFSGGFNTVYWGSRYDGAMQYDGVILE